MTERRRNYGQPPRYDFPNAGPLSRDIQYPGHGMPLRGDDDTHRGLTAWGRLMQEGCVGKKSVLIYQPGNTATQKAGVDMLTLRGDDEDAQPMILTLAPPTIVPIELSTIAGTNLQNVTGEQNNYQVSDNPFPGGSDPVVWPPIEAIIEWGVGGTSSKATVDFINGTTVNLTASYLRVHAQITPSQDDGIVGQEAAYVLAAFVGPGFTAPGVARRTVYVGRLGDGDESEAFPVPRFASRASVFSCDDADAPAVTVATLRFWQSAGAGVTGGNVGNFLVTGNQPAPFDVPNAGQYFSVINGAGSDDILFGVIFELAL